MTCMLAFSTLVVGLHLPGAPRAVSFAPGLLKPVATAEPVLRSLRLAGVLHLAAVSSYLVGLPEDTEADLLKGGALLDALLTATPSAEPSASPQIIQAKAAEEWVHVCGTVKELAGAKRVGARTLWLNEAAAADEHIRQFSDEEIERAQAAGLSEPKGYVARGIIADLADAVCARLEELPETLVALQATALAERKKAGKSDTVEPAVTTESQAEGQQYSPEYCVACGASLPAGAKFCPDCGDACGITLIQ